MHLCQAFEVTMRYKVKSPVLFIIFNRPDNTRRVFEQIKKARPSRIYIAADGPRNSHPGEEILCNSARAIVIDIDWDCEIKTFFSEENKGCKEAVSSAIDWFFEHEEEGIILEDDCLPADSFFKFCDILLEKYRYDTRVRHISGCNLQLGEKWGDGSYYFSNMTHVWGWAGWRRVWKDYDKTLSRYFENEVRILLENIFTNRTVIDKWLNIFNDVKAGKIDTWDYQLGFLNFINNGLSIIPNANLISNIGFGAKATHTFDGNNPYANLPLEELDEITDPRYVIPQKQADFNTLNRDFDIERFERKYYAPKRRFKRWFKASVLKQ
jgi:hypothetical protein